MARPSVTNAVSALEASIGARLLRRTTRRSSLTAEGELFYERATQLLNWPLLGRRTCLVAQDRCRDAVSASTFPSRSAKLTHHPRLPEFTERYPDIEIILGVSDQPGRPRRRGCRLRSQVGRARMLATTISRVVARVPMESNVLPPYTWRHGVPKTMKICQAHRAGDIRSPGVAGARLTGSLSRNG